MEHLWPCGGWESSELCTRGGLGAPPASSVLVCPGGASERFSLSPTGSQACLVVLFPGTPPTPCTPGSDSGPLSACATCHFPLMPSHLVSGASGSLSRVSAGLNLFFCLEAVLSSVSLPCLSLSLVLCLPPPLPAPPSPHPELSLGNRKFGGSERYQEAQLLPPRDKVRVGGAGWMGDGGAQNPPRLPPGPAAETDRNYITPSGLSPTLWGLGLITRSPFGVPVRIQPSLLAGAGAWGWGAGNGASEGEREGLGWGEAGWVW